MAIDTAAKRYSMLDLDLPSSPALGPPSLLSDVGTRLHLLWLYSGFAPIVAVTPAERIITFRGLSRRITFRRSNRSIAA
jgi:hypothetical protein